MTKRVIFNRSQSVCQSERQCWFQHGGKSSRWFPPHTAGFNTGLLLLSLWRESLTRLLKAPTAVANVSLLGPEGPSSFLPPHFGFLDRPEVRVVDHVVFVGFRGGNDAAGRKHGVLFVGSWIISDVVSCCVLAVCLVVLLR